MAQSFDRIGSVLFHGISKNTSRLDHHVEHVISRAGRSGFTIATAESCTAGEVPLSWMRRVQIARAVAAAGCDETDVGLAVLIEESAAGLKIRVEAGG